MAVLQRVDCNLAILGLAFVVVLKFSYLLGTPIGRGSSLWTHSNSRNSGFSTQKCIKLSWASMGWEWGTALFRHSSNLATSAVGPWSCRMSLERQHTWACSICRDVGQAQAVVCQLVSLAETRRVRERNALCLWNWNCLQLWEAPVLPRDAATRGEN